MKPCAEILFAMISLFMFVQPETAIAQSDEPVEARYVGLSGGVIAGAELVIAAQAIFGVDKIWAYLTFPVFGAVGGGVGGYFFEKNTPAGASVALLVGSMALVIPTALLARSAFTYDPEEQESMSLENTSSVPIESTLSDKQEKNETTTEVEPAPKNTDVDSQSSSPVEGPPAPKPDEPKKTDTNSASPENTDSKALQPSSKREDTTEKQLRMAKLRRATAGSLIFIDNSGTASISMPFIDVRMTTMAFLKSDMLVKQGVEVMVPLLKIDIP